MNLDVTTIRLAALAVAVGGGGIFLVDVFLRRPSAAGRCWALMSISGMLAALAAAVWSTPGSGPWAWLGLAIADGATVATPVCFWCGARAYNGRRSGRLLLLAPAAGLVAAVAVPLDWPGGGIWAGSVVSFAGVAVFAALGAAETLRGRLWGDPTARALTVVFAVTAGYSLARAAAYVWVGPNTPEFRSFFGTGIAALLFLIVAVVVVPTLVVLQSERVERRRGLRVDGPLLRVEVLSPAAFDSLAADQLRRGAAREMQLVWSRVLVDDRDALRAAYGRASIEVLDAEVAAALVREAPPGAIVGLDAAGGYRMLQTTPHVEAAAACGRAIQAGLRSLASADAFGVTITASIGVAGTDRFGYEADGLAQAAAGAAEAAVAEGGDGVVAA